MKSSVKNMLGKNLVMMTAAALAAILIAIGIVAAMVSGEMLELEKGKMVIAVIVVIISGLTAYLTAKQASQKRLLMAITASGVLTVLLLLIKVLLLSTYEIEAGWQLYAIMLASLPAGAAASRKKVRRR